MRIVPVEPHHIPALSVLAEDTFTESFGHLYPPQDLAAFVAKSYAVPQLAIETVDPANFWRLVLDTDQRPIAYLQCGPVTLPHPSADRVREGELKRIYVRRSHQGLKLGKTLLQLALGWMQERYGDAAQWIGVYGENHRAQALYAAYGFKRVGDYRFAVGETLDEEFILSRQP